MATARPARSEEARGWRPRLPERLPHLEGRRGAFLRRLYLAVALVALVNIAGSFWFNARDYFGNMPTAAAYGFRTATRDGEPRVAGAAGAEAQASGLRRGDRFLAIDGQPVPEGATEYTIAERLARADGRATIVTRSEDGELRTHRLTRSPVTRSTIEPVTQLPLWLFIALGFVSTQVPLVIWLAASLLLVWRRPRDPEAMLFAFGFLLMSMNRAAAFWLSAIAGLPGMLFEATSNLGACLLLAAMTGFPDGRFQSGLSRITLAAVTLLVALVPVSAATDLPLPTGLLFLFCTVGALGSVWLRYRQTAGRIERQQIKWGVFGFCAALALLVPMQIGSLLALTEGDGALPYIFDTVVPNLALLLMAAGLLVSLLRYRLYDAEAAISRSAGYAVLTLLLGATFAASAEGLEYFFENSLGQQGSALPGAIAAALAVVLITPLNERIQNWAERRFRKGLIRLRRDLPECVADLRETSALEPLLEEVIERVSLAVRATRAAVVIEGRIAAAREVPAGEAEAWAAGAGLNGSAEELDCTPADPLFPMRVPLRVRHRTAEPVGWLLLGPRPDGSLYGKDEREALAEIADPVARAVQIVMLREGREAAQEARLAAFEEKLNQALRALGGTGARPVA